MQKARGHCRRHVPRLSALIVSAHEYEEKIDEYFNDAERAAGPDVRHADLAGGLLGRGAGAEPAPLADLRARLDHPEYRLWRGHRPAVQRAAAAALRFEPLSSTLSMSVSNS